jgi:tRNA modification GTPase
VVLIVLDRSRPIERIDRGLLAATASRPRVIVANKSDLDAAWHTIDGCEAPVPVSAATGDGIDTLRRALIEAASGEPLRDVPAITNVRHVELLTQARAALDRAAAAAAAMQPEELVVADLTDARRRLEEVTGARTSDDVLREIFSRFCIGK